MIQSRGTIVGTEKKIPQPLRNVGMRFREWQGELFGDGTSVKHFAVSSDISAPRLLQWHREKAGTIEMVHDVLKNELAAGVLPCGRFGANAACLRLAGTTYETDSLEGISFRTINIWDSE